MGRIHLDLGEREKGMTRTSPGVPSLFVLRRHLHTLLRFSSDIFNISWFFDAPHSRRIFELSGKIFSILHPEGESSLPVISKETSAP